MAVCAVCSSPWADAEGIPDGAGAVGPSYGSRSPARGVRAACRWRVPSGRELASGRLRRGSRRRSPHPGWRSPVRRRPPGVVELVSAPWTTGPPVPTGGTPGTPSAAWPC